MTETQTYWLKRLTQNPKKRLRYGAPGMPERTADALVRLGVVRTEWQRTFLRSPEAKSQSLFVVMVDLPTDTKVERGEDVPAVRQAAAVRQVANAPAPVLPVRDGQAGA